MSLINQMLTDLEARRARAPRDQDRALDGLVAVAPRRLARERHAAWLLIVVGLAVLALAAGWSARSGFALLSTRVVPIAAQPKTTMTMTAVAAPVQKAAELAVEATANAREEQPPAKRPAAPEEPVSEALVATAAAFPAAAAPPAPVAAAAEPASPPAPATELADPTLPAKSAPVRVPSEVAQRADVPIVERRGDFHRKPAAKAEPKLPSALDRAYALLDLGRVDAGLDGLTAYLRASPKDVGARVRLAAELIKLDRTSDAEIRLREGLALVPNEARFARPLAHLVFDRGDARAALAVLQPAAPPVKDDVEYHAFMAALQQQIGEHTAAAMTYRAVLEQRADNGAWWIGLGISLDATGDHADAARAFASALGDHGLSEPMRTYATRELVRLKDRSY